MNSGTRNSSRGQRQCPCPRYDCSLAAYFTHHLSQARNLELSLGLFVPLVDIRVVFSGQAAVSLLYLFRRGLLNPTFSYWASLAPILNAASGAVLLPTRRNVYQARAREFRRYGSIAPPP